MIYAGLDAGSRTIKLVTLDGDAVDFEIVETGVSPLKRCRELIARSLSVGRTYERLMITGYGRHLVAPVLQGETVSEIKAFGTGARYLFPDCFTVIDIGGQDCKIIRLSDQGEVQKFEMNDRCAAGTGKFLEVMARTLEVDISEISELALSTTKMVQINSLCTVFAESEVVSLIARGEEASAIALALHESVATRISGMAQRTGIKEKVIFAGGAALNHCLRKLVSQKLGVELRVPATPQIIGALGAAVLARKRKLKVGGN